MSKFNPKTEIIIDIVRRYLSMNAVDLQQKGIDPSAVYHAVDKIINETDSTKRPEAEKKSLAQELYEATGYGCKWKDTTSKEGWKAIADRAVQVLLEGKDDRVKDIINAHVMSGEHNHRVTATAILTFLKSGGE